MHVDFTRTVYMINYTIKEKYKKRQYNLNAICQPSTCLLNYLRINSHNSKPRTSLRLQGVRGNYKMTDIELTDFQIGKPKRNTTTWFSILTSIMFLPFKIIVFFIPFKKNYTEVHGNWTTWNESGNRKIQRKVFAETGFDGMIKFYNLKFNNNTLGRL